MLHPSLHLPLPDEHSAARQFDARDLERLLDLAKEVGRLDEVVLRQRELADLDGGMHDVVVNACERVDVPYFASQRKERNVNPARLAIAPAAVQQRALADAAQEQPSAVRELFEYPLAIAEYRQGLVYPPAFLQHRCAAQANGRAQKIDAFQPPQHLFSA